MGREASWLIWLRKSSQSMANKPTRSLPRRGWEATTEKAVEPYSVNGRVGALALAKSTLGPLHADEHLDSTMPKRFSTNVTNAWRESHLMPLSETRHRTRPYSLIKEILGSWPSIPSFSNLCKKNVLTHFKGLDNSFSKLLFKEGLYLSIENLCRNLALTGKHLIIQTYWFERQIEYTGTPTGTFPHMPCCSSVCRSVWCYFARSPSQILPDIQK